VDAATLQKPTGVTGESVIDTATVTGSPAAFTPTGTVTYTLTGANGAALSPPVDWTVVNTTTWTDTVTLSGGLRPNSPPPAALPAGISQCQASYSADTTYAASTSGPEPLTISKGSSTTTTAILVAAGGPPSGELGGSVFDTATVTGSPAAFPPSGTVTYTLTG